MDRIARIDRSALSSGLFLDQKLQTAPLWVDASNVIFSNDKISVFPGALPLFTKTKAEVVTGLCEFSSIVTGTAGVLSGVLDTLQIWDATNGLQTVGTGYGGISSATTTLPATRWSMRQFNEWLIATNGYDPMQLLETVGAGFGAMTAYTSTQFKYAQIIRKYKQFVLAFNLTLAAGTRQPNAFAWCDVNDPKIWVPTATNSARKLYIPHLKSEIRCVEQLGEALIVYASDGAYAVTYAGYPDVFRADPLSDGIGAYGKNSVCQVKSKHIGIGMRGLWSFDGNSYDYIDSPPLRKYLDDNINKDQADKCIVYHNHTIRHVLFFFPALTDTENTLGIAWNYVENKFTKTAYARSAGIDTATVDFVVTGDSLGNVYRQSVNTPAQTVDDSIIPVTSSGTVYTGYGDFGYGDLGYGGFAV